MKISTIFLPKKDLNSDNPITSVNIDAHIGLLPCYQCQHGLDKKNLIKSPNLDEEL